MTLSDTQLDDLRKKIKNANNSLKLIFNSGIYNFNEFYRTLFDDTKSAAQAIAYVSRLSDKKPDDIKILSDIDLISYPIQVKYDSNGILITDPTAYTRKGVVQSNKPQTYVDPSTIPFTMQWYAARQQPEINTEITNKSSAVEQQTGSQNLKTNTKQATSNNNKAFNQAFAAARKAGKGTFEFNGTIFTTQLGAETPEQYQAWLASQNKSSNTTTGTTNQAASEAQKKTQEEAARKKAAEEAAAAQRKAAEEANREQFRMQLAQQMQANPWYRPTDETLEYTGWNVTQFQNYLASPEAEQRRLMQHKVNMQNSRNRTKENNQAYRQAKRKLRNMKVK